MSSGANPPAIPEPTALPEGSVPHRMGIVGRMVLLGIAVAVVVAVVAGFAAYPLVRDSAEARARGDLARLADLTATTVTLDAQGQFVVPPRVGSVLQDEEVMAYVVFRGTTELPDGVTRPEVDRVTSGRPVSAMGVNDEGTVLVEGRPLKRDTGVILVQPTAVAFAPALTVLWRVVAALALGIAVAVVVAVIASRRMSRSLREVSSAADQLSAGERDVIVEPRGPAEVALIAESINRLSEALAVSEGRQRDFLLSVSHELRTPLTGLLGYAQAMSDGLIEPDDVTRTGAVMVDEAERLQRLVTDLLDLARLEAVDFSFDLVPGDVGVVLDQAVEVWRDRCARVGVVVEREGGTPADGADRTAQSDPVWAEVDPVRLRQIIDNLAENALRVTPEGGRIIFALDRRVDPETDRLAVHLEVRDTGPGLTPADIPVAFVPGSLHERYRGVRPVGTGVGLALVARLARGLGGRAEAGSAREGGARFTVIWPAIATSA